MTGARAPVTRREMVELIEENIADIYRALERNPVEPLLLRHLQVYTAISLKLRMEESLRDSKGYEP